MLIYNAGEPDGRRVEVRSTPTFTYMVFAFNSEGETVYKEELYSEKNAFHAARLLLLGLL